MKSPVSPDFEPHTTDTHIQSLYGKGFAYSVPFTVDPLGASSIAFAHRIRLVAALGDITPVESAAPTIDLASVLSFGEDTSSQIASSAVACITSR